MQYVNLFDNYRINTIKTDFGYKYTVIPNEINDQVKEFLPVFVLDYSGSMFDSKGSAKELTICIKEQCRLLFEAGHTQIIISFFGETSYTVTVTPLTVNEVIRDVLSGCFVNDTYGYRNPLKSKYFSSDATFPHIAFNSALESIKKIECSDVCLIFMTDGQFSKTQASGLRDYKAVWKQMGQTYNRTGKNISITCIGYKDDQISNMQEMECGFKSENIPINYVQLEKAADMVQKFSDALDTNLILNAKVTISGVKIIPNECYYSKIPLFDNETSDLYVLKDMTPLGSLLDNNKSGVSAEWINQVIDLEINIGLYEQYLQQRITSVDAKKLLIEALEFMETVRTKYHELRIAYPSLKSRNIYQWEELTDRLQSISSIINEIQSMLNNTLNEKKQYEKATSIANHISAKHLRSIQRRKLRVGEVIQAPLTFSCVQGQAGNVTQIVCESKGVSESRPISSTISQLNEYYTCYYSLDNWEMMLSDIVGIPMHYVWKELDDWNASQAKIESLDTTTVMAGSSFGENQSLFGRASVPDHTKMFGSETFMKTANTKSNNCMLPIAIDPFFHKKITTVQQHLGVMLASSSEATKKSHIMFYAAALRHCFYVKSTQTRPNEKINHIILLIMNTFKILSDEIFAITDDKELKCLNKPDILYYIWSGNTAPHVFDNYWECIIYLLTSTTTNIKDALNKYGLSVSIREFKNTCWLNIVKFAYTSHYKEQVEWFTTETFNIKSPEELNDLLKTKGLEVLLTELVTKEKIIDVPLRIRSDIINIQKESWFNKVLGSLLEWDNFVNDELWIEFNQSFLPVSIKLEPDANKIPDAVLNELYYWAHLNVYAFGNKNCYPERSREDTAKVIITNINLKLNADLYALFLDEKEKQEFKQRKYETRCLPINFSEEQGRAINVLFDSTHNSDVSLEEFRTILRQNIDAHHLNDIDAVLLEDKLDVIEKLYKHCKSKKNVLEIKSTRLPFSTPANPSSPLFLQRLSDLEFSNYYKPIGYGYANKKYRDWIPRLHPIMVQTLNESCDELTFINKVIRQCMAEGYNFCMKEKYTGYIGAFYYRFNNNLVVN